MRIRDPIEWNESLLTGVDEIDQQHRILVNTLNEVDAKLGDSPNFRLFEQITRDLLAYAIYHFETEEQLITRYGYDSAAGEEADAHVRQHRAFSEQVIELRAQAHSGKVVTQEALLRFLRDWLIDHICNTDRRLAAFIRARSSQKTR
jgi:hemerythrin